jgi:hypothetical protein
VLLKARPVMRAVARWLQATGLGRAGGVDGGAVVFI